MCRDVHRRVQEPCMTHCMLHRENVVAKDMNDGFSNVRSLTRYEIFHPYLSFSSYSDRVQEPCMTHCMLHRENVVAKDMNDGFSNVRSLTRYEIFHPYLSFSSY